MDTYAGQCLESTSSRPVTSAILALSQEDPKSMEEFMMLVTNEMETAPKSQFNGTNRKNNCQKLITICGTYALSLENACESNSDFTALLSLLVSTLQSSKTLARVCKYLIHSYPTKNRQGVFSLLAAQCHCNTLLAGV